MESIYDQLFAFIVTVGIGFLAGFLFDIYRVFRGLWRPRKIGTFIGDIIFWIIMTCLVFILLLVGNWGEIRIYVFIGIALGYYIYIKYLTKKAQKFIRLNFIYIKKSLNFTWIVIIWPFRIILKVFVIPLGLLFSGFFSCINLAKKVYRKVLAGFKKIVKGLKNRQPKDKT